MKPPPQPSVDAAAGERFQRRLFHGFAAVAALFLFAAIGSALWAQNELTQVESVIAIQLRMMDAGEPLYRDTNQYPFTISPYGPLYYHTALRLFQLGLPGFLSQRLLSIVALLAAILLAGRVAWLVTKDRRAAAAAGLLAGSTALLQRWGTTGQSDMPALALSIFAFERYLVWRDSRRGMALAQCGLLIALSIYTKQSFAAAGFAVTILAIAADRKAGLKFAALLTAAGAAVAGAIYYATGGAYLDHAVWSHDQGFSWYKLGDHAQYFVLVSAPLWIVAAAPFFKLGWRAARGAHLYLAFSVVIFLLTSPKIGSDLNYQMEGFVLLAILAACALADLDFFRLRAAGDRGWITLLEIPVIFYIVLNAATAGRSLLVRVTREADWRQETRAIQPYLAPDRGRVLSAELNPLVTTRRTMEVEPLIYTAMVNAGRIDGEPVLRDLENRAFGVVILYEDLAWTGEEKNQEFPSLPEAHLQAMREHYRLVEHIPGPLLGGVYVYEPAAGAAHQAANTGR
jgi:hypothetical protein